MRFLVLQHVECEHPGLLAELMRSAEVAWDTVELDRGEAIPPLDGYAALFAFGGPMSVNDTERYPWLADEVRVIRDAVSRRLPFLGVCLGAQLLAKALGGAVDRARAPEVGVLPVALSDAGRTDPLLRGLPARPVVFQWHGETFTIPPGGVHLAGSDVCANQAFRIGRSAYGLQFHLEITTDMIEAWGAIPEYRAALEAEQGPGALEKLHASFAGHAAALGAACRTVFDNFLRRVMPASTKP